MGIQHSRSVDLVSEFRKFYIDSIESESVNKVYNTIMDQRFRTRKQMEALAIKIYYCAVSRPDLSYKYSKLVKKLKMEEATEDEELVTFQTVFNEEVLNFIFLAATNHNEHATDEATNERGKAVAEFLGNLYNVGVYKLEIILQATKLMHTRNGPKSPLILNHMLNIISSKLKEENITVERFHEMVHEFNIPVVTKSNLNPESAAIGRFYDFLSTLKKRKRYRFYYDYNKFEIISSEAHSVQIGHMFMDLYENEEFINVYRDIALEIHFWRPDLLLADLKNEFEKLCEKLESFKQRYDRNNEQKFVDMGNVVIEFYNSRLIDDEIVEYFLDITKSSNMPKELFKNIFVEVLNRYDGVKVQEYFGYIQEHAETFSDSKDVIAAVQGFVQGRGGKRSSGSKKLTIIESPAASLPDLREFTTKRIKHHSPFVCEDKPECHFACLRSIDILIAHSSHQFFTPNNIDICVKITKNMLKIPSEERISKRFEREIKTFLPYFLYDIEPGTKFKNFTNILSAFYVEGLITYEVIEKWMHNIYGIVSAKKHKFHGTFKEMYLPSFRKIHEDIMRDIPQSWLVHSDFIDSCEFAENKFEDFEKLKSLIEQYQSNADFTEHTKIKKLNIPNDRVTFKQISKYLTNFHLSTTTKPSYIASIYALLADDYEPQLDKNMLRSELQDVLCNKIGFISASDFSMESDIHKDGSRIIELVHSLCIKKQITRLGLAMFFSTIGKMLPKYPYSVRDLLFIGSHKLGKFFIGTKPLSTRIESLLIDVGHMIIKSLEGDTSDYEKAAQVLQIFKDIMNDSKNKKASEQINVIKSLVRAPHGVRIQRQESKEDEVGEGTTNVNEMSGSKRRKDSKKESRDSSSQNSLASSKSEISPQLNGDLEPLKSSKSSEKEDINIENEELPVYTGINHKVIKDHHFFAPSSILSYNFTTKDQVEEFCRRFIARVIANDTPLLFFVQSAMKIGPILQNLYVLKSQNATFKKVLIDEILAEFKGEKILVELMCELYNLSFVSKASMIAFVEKFKSPKPENVVLLQTFVRTSGLKLASQGDKQQLSQIRSIAKSIKNNSEIDEESKFIAQDLTTTLNLVITMIDNGQVKAKNLTIHDLNDSLNEEEFVAIINVIKNSNESADKTAEDLLLKSYIQPKIAARAACKFDGKVKSMLLQKCQNLLKDLPEIRIASEQFRNFVDFISELYISDVVKNEFINWAIEAFLKTTNEEISCQSIELLFEKCGSKMESVNKSKTDIYFKFFKAVLAENESSIRSQYFKRIMRLRARNWRVLFLNETFYEDFLMLYSINDANVHELIIHIQHDDEEVIKFIQVFWKVLLKVAPHPTHSELCSQISKSCINFPPLLTEFLTARCKTFIALSDEFYSDDVKQRLGRVVTFVAEIYSLELIDDNILEMWIAIKLVAKIPSNFISRIFSILSCCEQLERKNNIRLKALAANIETVYYEEISVRINAIVGDLKDINECGGKVIEG